MNQTPELEPQNVPLTNELRNEIMAYGAQFGWTACFNKYPEILKANVDLAKVCHQNTRRLARYSIIAPSVQQAVSAFIMPVAPVPPVGEHQVRALEKEAPADGAQEDVTWKNVTSGALVIDTPAPETITPPPNEAIPATPTSQNPAIVETPLPEMPPESAPGPLRTREEYDAALPALLSSLDITPNRLETYIAAFTHKQAALEFQKHGNYDRLEFLGDSLLLFVVNEALFEDERRWRDWEMAPLSGYLLSNEFQWKLARKLGLHTQLRASKEVLDQLVASPKPLADIFESLVGALLVDQGLAVAQSFIVQHVLADLETILDREQHFTPVYRLSQDIFKIAKRIGTRDIPEYTVQPPRGSRGAFHVEVYFQDTLLGSGSGLNEVQAKHAAAQAALRGAPLAALRRGSKIVPRANEDTHETSLHEVCAPEAE